MRKRAELIMACVWLALSSFYLYLTVDRLLRRRYAAQGWFPFITAVILVIVSAFIVWQSIKMDKSERIQFSWEKILLILASSVLLIYLLRFTNLLIGTCIYAGGMALALGYGWKKAPFAAIGTGLGIYLFFGVLVKVILR